MSLSLIFLKIQYSGKLKKINDIHIVLLYNQKEKWGNLKSKRSNRFYLNSDIDNSYLTALQDFHKKEMQFKSDLVAFGGL